MANEDANRGLIAKVAALINKPADAPATTLTDDAMLVDAVEDAIEAANEQHAGETSQPVLDLGTPDTSAQMMPAASNTEEYSKLMSRLEAMEQNATSTATQLSALLKAFNVAANTADEVDLIAPENNKSAYEKALTKFLEVNN